MDLSAQAKQSAQQGQQMLSQDQSQAATSKNDYATYSNEATAANKNLESEASYMQGAGSGQNVYNSELGTLEHQSGYDPAQLAAANKSLFSLTGSLNSANNAFNTPGGIGAYGMSAGSLGSYEGSILAPLQTGVANANTEVGTLNTEQGTLQTGAGQATTAQVQSEQNTVTALTAAVQNYQSQATAALQNMQFYSNLASTQGSLNASEQQSYAQAAQAYAAATQAIAQSKYILSQTTGQNLQNQQVQAAMNASKPIGNTGVAGNQVYYNKAGQEIGYENPTTHQDVQTVPNPPQPAPKQSGGGILSNLGSLFKNFDTAAAKHGIQF